MDKPLFEVDADTDYCLRGFKKTDALLEDMLRGFGKKAASVRTVATPPPQRNVPVPHRNIGQKRQRTYSFDPQRHPSRQRSNDNRPPLFGHRSRSKSYIAEEYPVGFAIVFDTCSLMHLNPLQLRNLATANTLIVPFVVMNELDTHMHRAERQRSVPVVDPSLSNRANMASDVKFFLDAERKTKGNVRIGGISEVDQEFTAAKRLYNDVMNADDIILGSALYFCKEYRREGFPNVLFCTDDRMLRLKASSEPQLRIVETREILHWRDDS